ncbi:hypothetical protein JCM6882_006159 [Rhodosporidiobolus microsporus]
MFTSFSRGSDDPSNWNDSPAYVPGRFHAHALPSSSATPSASRASSVHNLPFSPSSPPPLKARAPLAAPSSSAFASPSSRVRHRSAERISFARPLFRAPPSPETERREARNPLLASFLGGFAGPAGSGAAGGAAEGAIEEEREDEDEEGYGWLRPGRKKVERWMEAWWKRWALLVGAPCLIIWVWCSIPFPVSDPYKEEPPWHIPWPPTTDPPSWAKTGFLSRLPWLHFGHRNATSPAVQPVGRVEMDDGVELWTHQGEQQQVLELEYVEVDRLADSRSISSGDVHSLPTEADDVTIPPGGDTGSLPGGGGDDDEELPVDANFFFFLFVYYGAYLAIALVFVTKLFDLYRLNWWPSSLGGSISYTFFWLLSLSLGLLLHLFDLDGFGRRTRSRRPRPSDEWDWERKTTWVLLAFVAMSMPALACFAKLRKDRRNSYRRSLTAAQKTFLERQLTQRMPRSYRRFLWFTATLGLSLVALIMGQAFATVYLSTLPHSTVEGVVYVWTWIITVNVLAGVSKWILQYKVRSQALVFLFQYYYFLLYFTFYRNLFARLRSPDQAAWITALSSSVVIIVYPLTMSRTFWRLLRWAIGLPLEWEDYVAEKGRELYLRNLSEVVTMIAFLGYLSILHWGPNQQIYPFFAFDSPDDPYTYRLTLTASLVIFVTELFSSWVARGVCWVCYGVDVTNLGLDQFREHPELVIASIFTSCHVLSDILLFLVKLNFR